MRRVPTNVAFDPDLIRRIRVIAAKNGERVAHVIERLVQDGIDQEELQSLANETAVR